MKKICYLIISFILLYSYAYGEDSVADKIKDIKPKMTRTMVRSKLGLPLQMRGNIWKYKDFIVIFQAGVLECVVKEKCFGKWSNCHSFKTRSPGCILIK